MKRTIITAGALAGLLTATSVKADTEWHSTLPTVTSAGLANLRATFLGTSGLSWPDGSQAVVTFWRREGTAVGTGEDVYVTYRCVDYFTPAMQMNGGKCELTGAGRIPVE